VKNFYIIKYANEGFCHSNLRKFSLKRPTIPPKRHKLP
jgi:hypothetical protein